MTSQIDVPHIKNKHSSLGDNFLARDMSFNGSVLHWNDFGNECGEQSHVKYVEDKCGSKIKVFTWANQFKSSPLLFVYIKGNVTRYF